MDLFTTPNVFTPEGEAELLGLARPASISSHEAIWPRVPLHLLEELARLALRTTLRPGNCERSEAGALREREPADNVLSWKIPA